VVPDELFVVVAILVFLAAVIALGSTGVSATSIFILLGMVIGVSKTIPMW
jgi:hypothetical protein